MTQEPQPPIASRDEHYQQLDAIHRQQTRRYIILPFFLVVLLLIVVLLIVLSLRTPTQVALISDMMLTIFVLCPLMLCLFPLVMVLVVMVVGMSKLHQGSKSPLRRLEQMSFSVEQNIDKWAGIIDRRVINLVVKFAPIHRILTIFDSPSPLQEEVKEDHGESKSTNKPTGTQE